MPREWNDKSGWFRKSFADIDNATLRLNGLRNKVAQPYSDLRTAGAVLTPATLKAAVAAEQTLAAPTPGLVELLDAYREVLVARGFRANTVKGYKTTRNAVAEWVLTLPAGMTVVDYNAAAHDGLVGWLRAEKGQSQNTIAGVVKHLKPFLA